MNASGLLPGEAVISAALLLLFNWTTTRSKCLRRSMSAGTVGGEGDNRCAEYQGPKDLGLWVEYQKADMYCPAFRSPASLTLTSLWITLSSYWQGPTKSNFSLDSG
ncbi:hypothetical protein V8F06_000042 [Rhypophila decipiens]